MAALAAAGCGGGSAPGVSATGRAAQSGQQVVDAAAKAGAAAKSFHMSGQVTEDGKQIAIDFTIVKGTGALGTMTFDGQPVDMVVVGGSAYIWAGPDFWKQFGGPEGATVAQLVANKWLRFPTSNPAFAGFTKLADSKSMFTDLRTKHGALTNKGATTYNGQSVIDIFDDSPTDGGDLYVAATGPAYPVGLGGSGIETGSVTFDGWDKTVPIAAPSGAIDLSYFTGG